MVLLEREETLDCKLHWYPKINGLFQTIQPINLLKGYFHMSYPLSPLFFVFFNVERGGNEFDYTCYK